MERRVGRNHVPKKVRTLAKQPHKGSQHDPHAHTQLVQKILESFINRRDVLAWQNSTGFAFTPTGHPVKYGLVGSPDIFLIKEGKLICIEVKTGNGRLSDMQKHFRYKVTELGVEYIVARSVEDVSHL
jgi:hypothetical protein